MDYVAKAISVQAKIHADGGLVQYNKGAAPVIDPVGRTRTDATPVVSEVFAVIDETNKYSANTFVQGTTQYSRMRDLLIAGLDLPDGIDQANDTFTFENGTLWRIITFELLSPDNITPILYTVTVGA